ncbi:hypothetical protein CA233_21765 [Sphingomonas sp. ABOLD]|uniref:Uncharacterized protein n=1 Tax=Sphingomonas trueperi TaxID=53317 RepID=A0A7X6BCH4_9SPHN|nr:MULTISPECIES: hypothetical protein [Sphingomonas]NJB96662.1 hypothetical protein [Sphingomonas trueperi]RSV38001.1 hypothetical protein CA233_21765 [Sphingomonas sp. ABOLD]
MKLPATSTGAPANAASSKQEEMAARKLQQAKDAVATLKTIKTKTSDDQKARAAQKVQELKARLQALKMIYAGDPKKLARAAAQIARELAAAVKSYTSAGGSRVELGGVEAGDASASAAAPAGDAKAEGAGAGAGAGEATPTAETAEKDKVAAEGDASQPEAASSAATKQADEKRAADAARANADDDFRNEARALARELKAALRRKDHKHRDEDPRDGSDKRSAEQALAAVEQAVGALPMADVAAVGALAGI